MNRTVNSAVIILVSILIFLGAETKAQKSLVDEKLKMYGIEDDFFVDNLSEESATHAFTVRITEETSEKTTVNIASFDPLKNKGKRWELISVNGNAPNSKETKNFLKGHNSSDDALDAKQDDDDWSVVKDDDHFLVIGFKYKEASLPHKYKFLSQCNAEIYIDKEARKLYKVRFYNTGEMKIKIFKVVKLDFTQKYKQEEGTGTYLIDEEDMVIDAKLLGQIVEVKTNTVFYDYEKIK